jgi:hypothetical protein
MDKSDALTISCTAGLMTLRLRVMASLKTPVIVDIVPSDALTISGVAGLIALQLRVMASLKTIADIIPIDVWYE